MAEMRRENGNSNGPWALMLLAFAASAFPILYWNVGLDVITHTVGIACFTEQFWQGNFYPRMCFNANAGFGSPNMLLYYPLSYYIAALLHPLGAVAGMSDYLFFRCMLVLAGGVSLLTMRHWLSPIAGERIATLCAIMYLFMPYRQEVGLYRSAIGEAWGLAIAPLVFHSARLLVIGEKHATLKMMLATAAMIVSSLPTAIGILLCAGIYIYYFRWKDAAAVAVAVAVAVQQISRSPQPQRLQTPRTTRLHLLPPSSTASPEHWGGAGTSAPTPTAYMHHMERNSG